MRAKSQFSSADTKNAVETQNDADEDADEVEDDDDEVEARLNAFRAAQLQDSEKMDLIVASDLGLFKLGMSLYV